MKLYVGLNSAFDDWILTGYSASRITDAICYLTANTFASKVKGAAASLASAFRAPAFAPIAA